MSLGTSILFRSLDARSLGGRSFLSCAVVPEEFSLSVPLKRYMLFYVDSRWRENHYLLHIVARKFLC